jgi:hypothetical protein
MQGFIILAAFNMIKGTYILYENGKEIYRSPNVITKFGKRFITNFIAGNIASMAKDIAIGIDSTSATDNDTRLGFEFYRTPVLLSSTDIQTVDSEASYSIIYKATIPQDIAGVISEIGLYPSTRLSSNNYDSKFISDFDSPLTWTDGDGFSPLLVQSNSKIGDNILMMNSNGTSAEEYTANFSIDMSGYSVNDSIRIAYYKEDTRLQNIKLRFYSSDSDYYELTVTPASGTGYKVTSNIYLTDLYTNPVGSPLKDQINKIGIIVTPTSGNETSVGLDAIRINDEDTFDPIFGLISRSVLAQPVTKLAGRQIDIEYKIDLSF